MAELLISMGFGLLKRLVTEVFIAKIAVHSFRAWSDTTENTWDDKVVDAVAEGLGVDSKALKAMLPPAK